MTPKPEAPTDAEVLAPPILEDWEIDRFRKHGDPFWKRVAATLDDQARALTAATQRVEELTQERDDYKDNFELQCNRSTALCNELVIARQRAEAAEAQVAVLVEALTNLLDKKTMTYAVRAQMAREALNGLPAQAALLSRAKAGGG